MVYTSVVVEYRMTMHIFWVALFLEKSVYGFLSGQSKFFSLPVQFPFSLNWWHVVLGCTMRKLSKSFQNMQMGFFLFPSPKTTFNTLLWTMYRVLSIASIFPSGNTYTIRQTLCIVEFELMVVVAKGIEHAYQRMSLLTMLMYTRVFDLMDSTIPLYTLQLICIRNMALS